MKASRVQGGVRRWRKPILKILIKAPAQEKVLANCMPLGGLIKGDNYQ